MKLTYLTVIVPLLCACGAEPLGAAATAASIKKQELQQGQQTLERSKAKIDQALQLQQQRADQSLERN